MADSLHDAYVRFRLTISGSNITCSFCGNTKIKEGRRQTEGVYWLVVDIEALSEFEVAVVLAVALEVGGASQEEDNKLNVERPASCVLPWWTDGRCVTSSRSRKVAFL
jgi:pyruvate-formate lyase-activating enzyme